MITSLKKKDVCTSKRSQGKRQLRPFRGTHRHLKESSSSSSSHQDRLQDSMTPLSASEIKMDKLLFSPSKTSDTCLNLSAGITENTNVQDKASNLSTKKKRLSGASGHILSKEKVINARSTCGKRKSKNIIIVFQTSVKLHVYTCIYIHTYIHTYIHAFLHECVYPPTDV